MCVCVCVCFDSGSGQLGQICRCKPPFTIKPEPPAPSSIQPIHKPHTGKDYYCCYCMSRYRIFYHWKPELLHSKSFRELSLQSWPNHEIKGYNQPCKNNLIWMSHTLFLSGYLVIFSISALKFYQILILINFVA